jgi:hypothetical protein
VSQGPGPTHIAVPEAYLEATGYVLKEGNRVRYVCTEEGARHVDLQPVECLTRPRWEDCLWIEFFTDVIEPGDPDVDPLSDEAELADAEWEPVETAMKPILDSATATVRALVDTEYDESWVWGGDITPGEPIRVFDFIEPKGDVVAAYERLTGSPLAGWEHYENWQARPCSAWVRAMSGTDEHFLAPGTQRAHVTCHCYSTPTPVLHAR